VLKEKVLARNDYFAEINRNFLKEKGAVAVNIISSPGSGKTTLLEKTLDALKDSVKCAVIAGDIETNLDAARLSNRGAEVRQIETHNLCHLNAEQVGRALQEVVHDGVKLLFIENVGNLVCPAAYDLGENFKIALLSVTEGEDKPLKYPVIFSSAQTTVISKIDLAPHLDFKIADCRKNIHAMRPGVFIFELSAKTGAGMELWTDYLRKLVE
jgi:hydrogenase nickel incorporation protein HypB